MMPDRSHDPTRVPLLLEPELVARPWGGRRLAHLAPVGSAPEGPIGEAWLAGPDSRVAGAARRGVQTEVEGAAPAGTADAPDAAAPAGLRAARLDDLAAQHGEAFVGRVPFARYGARVPFLAKLLDAAQPLSLQVHPDDAYALREEAHTGHLGKTEAWYVLEAAPGASVLWGWEREVDESTVRAAIEAGRLEQLLRRVPVRAGDVIVNQAGVVHAVGAGILLYELQQASDLTYRLYDYDRRDERGLARDLHLEKGLAVARLAPEATPEPARPLGEGRTRLARTEAFTIERWAVGCEDGPREQVWQVAPDSLEVWTVLEGTVRLTSMAGRCELRAYDTLVVPANAGALRWQGRATLVQGRA